MWLFFPFFSKTAGVKSDNYMGKPVSVNFSLIDFYWEFSKKSCNENYLCSMGGRYYQKCDACEMNGHKHVQFV